MEAVLVLVVVVNVIAISGLAIRYITFKKWEDKCSR